MAGNGNETTFPLVRGLPNSTEENKCFFNAVIQCLAHTPHILSALKDPDDEFHLPGDTVRLDESDAEIELPPISGQLGAKGKLTTALAETLDELQKFDEGHYDAHKLFDAVTECSPQFADGKQHDCHEFMREFLEKIKAEDLNRICEEGKRTTRRSRQSMEQRRQYMGIAAEHIFSGKVFRGELVSTLTCQECKKASPQYEEFLDLSLPTYVDKLEEMVATKRNAPRLKSRTGTGRGCKRNTEQALVTPNDTDDDVDHNGNSVDNASTSESPHGIICNGKKVSSLPANNQLSENFENLDLIEKRHKIKRTEFSTIEDCLKNFTECEVMDGNNKVACNQCAINTKATKQYLIYKPPNILILHLKRFEFGDHNGIRKKGHHVKFPLQLDLSPFRSQPSETLYSLYAIVKHTQRGKNNGHYTAYVKVRPNIAASDPRWQLLSKRQRGQRQRSQSSGQIDDAQDNHTATEAADATSMPTRAVWYKVSDTDVEMVEEDKILNTQAYLLFYERV